MTRPSGWKLVAWSVPAWAIVGLAWFMAVTRQPRELLIGLGIGAGALVIAWIVVTAWVAHNRSLARRREAQRGGRRGAPDVPLAIERDARGRSVQIIPGAVQSRVVVVSVAGDRKSIAPEEAP